jgi:hypothetical protein
VRATGSGRRARTRSSIRSNAASHQPLTIAHAIGAARREQPRVRVRRAGWRVRTRTTCAACRQSTLRSRLAAAPRCDAGCA